LVALFANNDGVPPFIEQHPENSIEFFACPFPGWNAAKKTLSFKHLYVTGCARVHSGDNDQGGAGQSGLAFFCTCCQQGREAWNQIQLFHDVSGGCTIRLDCMHAKTLGMIAAHHGFDTMMLAGRNAGAWTGAPALRAMCVSELHLDCLCRQQPL
jgi:hypothetical protein